MLSYSSARQPVAIPYGAGKVLLDFWTWRGPGDGSDRQEADFLSPGGLVLQKFWRVLSNDQAWVEHIIPGYLWNAGNTRFWRYLNAYNEGVGSPTGMYLDDVHLWACSGQVVVQPLRSN